MKKQLLISFLFISLFSFGQAPQRFNKVIVTGDITSPKFIKTGSNADSVLLGNGLARSVNSLKTDTVNLSNRINAKATGNGTANGTNTGDETLTSIKTKLGAATSVSDGYLKYQDFALLHTPTTVTASNGLSISGQNISLQNASLTQSGALTFNDWNTFNSKEPAITKNTAFNKNFGTTPGTVLEGRTFGTAAGSAIGDFQPAITGLTTNYIPKWNGSNFVNSLISDDGSNVGIGTTTRDNGKLVILKNSVYNSYTGAGLSMQSNTANAYTELQLGADDNVNIGYIQTLQKNTSYLTRSLSLNPNGGNVQIGYGADQGYKLAVNGTGKFSSSVTAASFIGSGSNLTGVQLPITLTTNGTSGAATFSGNVLNVPNYTSSGAYVNISPSSVQSGSIWIDGIVNSSTVSAPSINTSYINFNSIPNGQQTSGSVSGNVIFNMPFNGAFYKKVIITLLNLQGSASWTFTSSFSNLPVVLNTDGLPSSIVTSKSLTSITLNCVTPTSGILILEGY